MEKLKTNPIYLPQVARILEQAERGLITYHMAMDIIKEKYVQA